MQGPKFKKNDQKKSILELKTSIQYLKGVGPHLGDTLSKRGITKVEQLLAYFPRAFEDRRAARSISSLKEGDIVGLQAKIVRVSSIDIGSKGFRKIYDIAVQDASGLIHCKFFRAPYKGYFSRFESGQSIRVIGKVILYRGRLEFHHPELRESGTEEEISDDLVPIYPEIEGLTSGKLLRLIRSAISQLQKIAEEKLPESLRAELKLLSRDEALRKIHYPDSALADLYHQFRSPAQRRLIFEEFFWLELFLAAKRSGLKKESGIAIPPSRQTESELVNIIPFTLTKAQQRAIDEISRDLAEAHPMHRLVQGDVGCGKTMVAFVGVFKVLKAGHQACLMAPTEILAEQHYNNASRFFATSSLRIARISSRTKTLERREILEHLVSGKIQFIIGTHALIEEDIVFQSLALAIVDEQHRFGVEQKMRLKAKGLSPHMLVMTATPIPRTLAMTVYGDLDVSLIDEMPPGRQPVKTRVISENKRPMALEFVREQLQKGRQAYFVYPLVEESEKMDLKDAQTQFAALQGVFPEYKLGLLHGKMSGADKDSVMTEFREGRLQVLVSTTVIEVGVDVANANIMVIEHAERFGLSQLHQLRGRVGRGSASSFCVMIMGYAVSEDARLRVNFMENNSDGFKVAEFDLELRGPGEFLGTRQSGLPGFQLANLVRDVAVLQEAREAAFKILAEDPHLLKAENQSLKAELLQAHGPVQLASIS